MTPEWLEKLRNKYLALMQNSALVYQHVLANVSQETATTLRDGDDGWTVLEVLCHVRDFDGFFLHRARMILEQEMPQLPAYDHDALAIERKYNEQDLQQVLAELAQSRAEFVTFFQQLTDEDWLRAGIHPEQGHFTLLDALLQVGSHDVNHLEQITRILR